MKINGIEYVPFPGPGRGVEPAWSYVKGEKEEEWWVDWQNCFFYFFESVEDAEELPWWIITPYIPIEGFWEAEEEEQEKMMIGIVSSQVGEDGYMGKDVGKLWDFENHCPVGEKIVEDWSNEQTNK